MPAVLTADGHLVVFRTEDPNEYQIEIHESIGRARHNAGRGGDLRIPPARGGRASGTDRRHKSHDHHGPDSGHESVFADDSSELDFPGRGDSRDALRARTILRGTHLQPGRSGRLEIVAAPRLGLVRYPARSQTPKF